MRQVKPKVILYLFFMIKLVANGPIAYYMGPGHGVGYVRSYPSYQFPRNVHESRQRSIKN
jgi:hypothetical protein